MEAWISPDLKRIGVVLKRALYFITCRGKTLYPVKIEEDYITRNLLYVKEKLPPQLQGDVTYQQLSLFDDGMPLSFGEQAGLLAAEGQELLTAGADAGGAGTVCMTTIFVCEDSLDGILTGVYEAWDSRLGHENVRLQTEAEGTLELFCQYRPVRRDLEKAEKVLRTVRRRMGEKAREAVCYAAACTDERKADAIYRLIVLGLSMADGTKAVDCLQNPAVLLVEKLRYKAWHEAERMLGFLRFEELENGVLYAPHGAALRGASSDRPAFRGSAVPGKLDHSRSQARAGRRPPGGRRLVPHRGGSFKCSGKREPYRGRNREFQKLWQAFCSSIAIEERRNPRCQQNLLPLRFRPYMTEFGVDRSRTVLN